MDSGNSGSMQSSSGGDEEYDSSFLNPSTHIDGISNSQAQAPSPHHNHPSTLFDPLSNYLDPFSRTAPSSNTNSLLNLDTIWLKGIRSEPNYNNMGTLVGSSSSSSQHINPVHQDSGRVPLRHQSSMIVPPGATIAARALAPSDQTNVVRNSKKRSRASRRAPTTVLTTDTSNFRAMVQEFTGIPAPPFSASASPFPRSRLDLFHNASLMMKSGHLEPPLSSSSSANYLLRPFAQKVQPPLFISPSSFSSSSMFDIARTTNTSTTSSNLTANNNNNYQLLFELGLPNQSQNLLNMENPILTSQSLLESTTPTTQYPLANVNSFFGSKSQGTPLGIPSTNSQLKVGVLDEFDMNHGNVGGFSNLVTSDGMSLRSENENNTSIWADGVGSDAGVQGHSRSFNGNFDNSRRVNGCKTSYLASSLDFNADKGQENVSSRGEGMVESWICSSD